MGTRTIQLDDDAEATLSVLCNQTGFSISEVLKRGLQAYAALAPKVPTAETPYEVFSRLDLGPGWLCYCPGQERQEGRYRGH